MSDLVVSTRNLSKSYTLFPSPRHRTASLFGLGRARSYPTHLAVDNVSLDIRAGERVAFIGRNGAGKSTLLKLITGVIEPTSGTVNVTGATHALLQMGAGFHPEFSGRRNAIQYLATLGLSRSQISKAIDEAVDFAELEEYIDQPLKTYSTGMQMRLIFAVSTTLAPKLFVVDEVLGVGDAYFQRKSFDRLKELCETNATTLLLVSHDIYSAAKICSRFVWIERGQIWFDGKPSEGLRLYEASIKEQEEIRLRKKALLGAASELVSGLTGRRLLVDLRPSAGHLRSPIELLSANVQGDDGAYVMNATYVESDVIPEVSGIGPGIELISEGSCWEIEQSDTSRNIKARMRSTGTVFKSGLMRIDPPTFSDASFLSLALRSDEAQSLEVRIVTEAGVVLDAGPLDLMAPGLVTKHKVFLDVSKYEKVQPETSQLLTQRNGTGEIRVTSLEVLDASGSTVRILDQGRKYVFAVTLRASASVETESLELLLAFFRNGVEDCGRTILESLNWSPNWREYAIVFEVDVLPFAEGKYSVRALLAKGGYYSSDPGKPFSLNPDVVDITPNDLQFSVKARHPAFVGTVMEVKGQWRMPETT